MESMENKVEYETDVLMFHRLMGFHWEDEEKLRKKISSRIWKKKAKENTNEN